MSVTNHTGGTQMISPPIRIRDAGGTIYNAYGWHIFRGVFTPVIANPDGPGIGDWMLYFGEDPWYPIGPAH
jgi:hypothetical protein